MFVTKSWGVKTSSTLDGLKILGLFDDKEDMNAFSSKGALLHFGRYIFYVQAYTSNTMSESRNKF